ncbi:MAG: single-stranded-DNA-specific exonuclease RecJ, partial [Ardenticatenales bacterium]|nr:single-stranded-DNA-specific exonuclease RecJ [Ardenticatenales bacterium]
MLWTIHPRAPEKHFARFAHLPWPVAQILFNRKLTTPAEVDSFFARQAEQDNPFHLRGMTEAVTRIRAAIEQGERILVHGDFDADGVTSTAVMVTGLHALGAEVAPYIPHRVDEGYGLNEEAVHKMKRLGISLMVTVDCGIRAHKEIDLANELGIDVVVTDHHSPHVLPNAYAIVNPHQEGCEYPHKMLAGVGLAWKTIQALTLAERKRPLGKQRAPVELEELLTLVAIGTVADIAPLTGENRKLVWRGLVQLRQTRRPGLLAMMDRARVKVAEADTETIGFALGPRINAAGRLDHAKIAYQLLRAQDNDEAYHLADELEQKNRQRQEKTQQALRRAYEQLGDTTAPLLLVSDEHCPEGIVGLVAGRLLEQFYRPTIVVSQGPEWSRASCRSIPEFHITQALDQLAPLLERHGGHAAAAGFTVRTENLPALEAELSALAKEALVRAAPGGDISKLAPRLKLDAELPLHEIDDTLIDALEQLAPFGAENSPPLWMSRHVRVREAQAVG